MNSLENISSEKLTALYEKYFSTCFLGKDLSNVLAVISLTCYVTTEIRKKGKNLNCYEVLLKIFKDSPEHFKNTFLKSLGVICGDFMYGCTVFPDFGVKSSEMPKTIKKIIDENFCPF